MLWLKCLRWHYYCLPFDSIRSRDAGFTYTHTSWVYSLAISRKYGWCSDGCVFAPHQPLHRRPPRIALLERLLRVLLPWTRLRRRSYVGRIFFRDRLRWGVVCWLVSQQLHIRSGQDTHNIALCIAFYWVSHTGMGVSLAQAW